MLSHAAFLFIELRVGQVDARQIGEVPDLVTADVRHGSHPRERALTASPRVRRGSAIHRVRVGTAPGATTKEPP